MTTDQVRQIFNRTFNGNRNFMTPVFIRYGRRGDFLYELSTNEARDHDVFGRIYGVTVLTVEGEKTTLNECFDTLEGAENYIASLSTITEES